jgi:KaiC/GvpD/RAD55 family RecA-like ATPase
MIDTLIEERNQVKQMSSEGDSKPVEGESEETEELEESVKEISEKREEPAKKRTSGRTRVTPVERSVVPAQEVVKPIEEKKPEKEFIETGIEGLDDVLGGGLPSRSLFLLIGSPGSHYTTFAQQILYNFVVRGGKVAYYLVENPSFDIVEDMAVYKWDLEKYIEKESWLFVNLVTPDMQELSEMAPGQGSAAKVILSQTLTTLKRDFLMRVKEGRWTVLHASHLMLRYDFRDVVDAILYMRLVTRHHHGLHFILIPIEVHEEQKINALKHLADGVFEFSIRERGREYEGVFTVSKLRRTLHRTRTHSFIMSDRGMYIERAERIT